ncbi:hypothetical protein D3C86_1815350 [compost metagenome]
MPMPVRRNGQLPSSINAGSLTNSRKISSGYSQKGAPSSIKPTAATLTTSQPQRWAATKSFSPRLWLTRVVAAMPRPMAGRISSSARLINTWATASSAVPTWPMIQNSAVMPVAKKNCWAELGSDSRSMLRRSMVPGRRLRKPWWRALCQVCTA